MQPQNWSILGPAGDSEMPENEMDTGPNLAAHSSTNLIGGTLSNNELEDLNLHLEESELLGNYYDEIEEEEEEAVDSPPVHSSKIDSD